VNVQYSEPPEAASDLIPFCLKNKKRQPGQDLPDWRFYFVPQAGQQGSGWNGHFKITGQRRYSPAPVLRERRHARDPGQLPHT
jgi:hypothetical protein